MAVFFETKTPKKLLRAFRKVIDDGHVVTWAHDEDGDFTHTAEQWVKRAWFKPQITEGERLSFFIIPPQETEISSQVYAIYHGRFIESMLLHCDSLFTEAKATALPEGDDKVG